MAKINGRPVLLAENNRLNPYIPGSAGWLIWRMLKSRVPSVSRREYIRAFERYSFDVEILKANSHALRTAFQHRIVLILGGSPHNFGLEDQLVYPQTLDNVTWRQLPFPSDPWYNDPGNRAVASMVFESMYLTWLEKGEA